MSDLRIFRLMNLAKNCWWLIAHDLDEAKKISVERGMVKKTENITLIGDQTDFYLNSQIPPMAEATKTMLKEGKVGFGAIEITNTAIAPPIKGRKIKGFSINILLPFEEIYGKEKASYKWIIK